MRIRRPDFLTMLLLLFVCLQLGDAATTIYAIHGNIASEANSFFGILNTHPYLAIPVKIVEVGFVLFLARFWLFSNFPRRVILGFFVFAVLITGAVVLNNTLTIIQHKPPTPIKQVIVTINHVHYADETFAPVTRSA